MNKIYLLIGGNMGDRLQHIQTAMELINDKIGTITRESSLYETAAWGNNDQPDFLNMVLEVNSPLDAAACMQQIFLIENQMGRTRNKKNDPRIMDIDILFFNSAVINEPGLSIPHPEIQNRRFVLVPMNELSPGMRHPALKKSISELLSTCTDQLEVRLLSDPKAVINNI